MGGSRRPLFGGSKFRRARAALVVLLAVSLALGTFVEPIAADEGGEPAPTTTEPAPASTEPALADTTEPDQPVGSIEPESPAGTVAVADHQPSIEGDGLPDPTSADGPSLAPTMLEFGGLALSAGLEIGGLALAAALDVRGDVFPAAPRNLRVVERTDTALTLAWDAPLPGGPSIDHYVLQSGAVTGGPWFNDYEWLYETSVTVPWSPGEGVPWSPGDSRRFSVLAVAVGPDGDRWGDRSNVLTVYQPLRAVYSVGATAGDGTASLTWEDVSPGDFPGLSYRVEQGETADGPWTPVHHTESPHWLATGLTNGVAHHYRIILEHDGDEGPPSEAASVTPMEGETLQLRPTLLSVDGSLSAGPGLGKVRVEWEPPAAVPDGWTLIGYEVQYIFLPLAYGWESNSADSTPGVTNSHVIGLSPGSDYGVRVRPAYLVPGHPDGVFGEPSNVIYVTVAPGAPTNLRVAPGDLSSTMGGPRSVRLDWDAPTGYDGIVGYRVEYQSQWDFACDPDCWYDAYDGLVAGTHATVSPYAFELHPYIEYRFRVRAVTIDGHWDVHSAPSNNAQSAPWEVLAAPAGVTATEGDATVLVAWDEPEEARTHEVQYAMSSTGPWTTAGSTDASELTVDGLEPGTTYWFRVRVAPDAHYVGAWSEPVSATPGPDDGVPAAPTELRVVNQTDDVVALEWDAPDGPVDHYVIEHRGLNGDRWQRIGEPAGPSFTTEYRTDRYGHYRVYAVHDGVEGALSDELTVYQLLPQVTGFFTPQAGDGAALLEWTHLNVGEWPGLWYRVERATVGNPFEVAGRTQSARWMDTELVNTTTYTYRIIAEHLGKEGLPSAQRMVTPMPGLVLPLGPPTLVSVDADLADPEIGLGQARVRWEAPELGGRVLDGYDIQYAPLTSGFWDSRGTVGPATTHTLSGLTPGERYAVRVVARESFGPTGLPSGIEFVTIPQGEPTNVRLADGDPFPTVGDRRAVSLDWDAPTGYVAGGYVVEFQETRFLHECGPLCHWTQADPAVITDTHATVSHDYLDDDPDADYHFRVRAVVGTGSNAVRSWPSDAVRGESWLVHDWPSDVVATGGGRSVRIAWAEPDTPRPHQVQIQTPNGTWSTAGHAPAGTSEFTAGDLDPETEYFFRVRVAPGAGGVGRWSDTVSATTLNGPEADVPSVPTGLVVSRGDGTITLSWGPPGSDGGSPVTGYRIFRGQDPTPIIETTEPSVTIAGFVDQAQVYRIAAVNAVGEGPIVVRGVIARNVPAAPELTAVAGDGRVELSWNSVGVPQAAILYSVQRATDPGGPWTNIATLITEREATATGLANGTTYLFRVHAVSGAADAVNDGNLGPGLVGPDSNTVAVTPVTVTPSAPQDFVAQRIASTVTLTWSEPPSDGGSPITGYTVSTATSPTGPWTVVSANAFSGMQVVDEGSEPRWFRVIARNINGNGEPATVAMTTITVPSAPIAGAATVDDGPALLVSWQPPVSDGGLPVTGYRVELNIHADWWASWNYLVAPTETSLRVPLSVLGDVWHARVFASNSVGESEPSDTMRRWYATLPSAPRDVSTVAGDGQVVVSWAPPDDVGFMPFTGNATVGYTLEWREPGGLFGGPRTATTEALSHTVIGLDNGTSYEFRVRAVTQRGEEMRAGAYSSTVAATPVTVPGAPTIVSAEVDPLSAPGQVRLVWSPPASDGGSPITSSIVETRLSATTWGPVTPIASTPTSVTFNADIGVPRQYRVSAVNAVGVGAPSAVTTVTATAPPSAPPTITASVDPVVGGTVHLAWGAPANNGGSPITDWIVEYQLGAVIGDVWQVVTNAAIATQPGVSGAGARISGLTIGAQYRFRVRAVNAVGVGAPSTAASVTATAGVPSAPQAFLAQPGAGSVTFTWNPPASDGGAPITGYTLSSSASPNGPWTVVTNSAFSGLSVGGFGAGDTHWFRVFARNSIGFGEPAVVASSPMAPPATPSVNFGSRGDGWTRLLWIPPIVAGNPGAGAPGAATAYRVERANLPGGPWTAVATTSERNFTATAPGHQPANLARYYRVIALNAGGESPPSGPVAVIVRDAPGAVTELRSTLILRYNATPLRTDVRLYWLPPAAAADATITYRVERADAAAGPWSTMTETAATQWFGDALGGTTHHYRVTALNGAGDVVVGGFTPGSGTATGVAGPATHLTVLNAEPPAKPWVSGFGPVGEGYATLNWSPPSLDGHSPVTGYRFERQQGNGGWVTIGTSSTPSITVHQAPNVAINYRAFAINAAGDSPPGYWWWPLTLRAAPAAVTITTVRPYGSRLDIAWTAASAVPGESIRYRLERADSPGGPYTPVETTHHLSRTVYDLPTGTTSWFRVVAMSAIDASTYVVGAPSEPVRVTQGAPQAAAWLTATATIDGATLRWHVPPDEGAAPIDRYLVQRQTEVGEWVNVTTAVLARYATEVELDVPGLTVGGEYRFRVVGVNAVGDGVPSNVASAVPLGDGLTDCLGAGLDADWLVFGGSSALFPLIDWANPCRPIGLGAPPTMSNGSLPAEVVIAVPSAPALTATSGMGKVTLDWTAPSEPGVTAVHEYRLQRLTGYEWTDIQSYSVATTSHTATVTETAYGTHTWYRVIAVNADGWSEPAEVAGGPITVPRQPATAVAFRVVDDAKVRWTLTPDADGGSPITGFTVVRSPTSFEGALLDPVVIAQLPASAREFVDDTTHYGGLYFYEVRAVNALGPSFPTGASDAVNIPHPPSYRPQFEVHATGEREITVWYGECTSTNPPWGSFRFVIERSTNGTDWSDWRTVNHTSRCETIVDTGLTAGVTYHYRLWVEEPGGIRATTSSVIDSDKALMKPMQPVIVSLTALAGRVTITFIPSPSLELIFSSDDTWAVVGPGCLSAYGIYEVYKRGQPDESEALVGRMSEFPGHIIGSGLKNVKWVNLFGTVNASGVATVTFDDPNGLWLQGHDYRMRACNAAGVSAPSNTVWGLL